MDKYRRGYSALVGWCLGMVAAISGCADFPFEIKKPAGAGRVSVNFWRLFVVRAVRDKS